MARVGRETPGYAGSTDEEAMSDDPIVTSVREKLAYRSRIGIGKYGTTMARTDLSRLDWLIHAQEELLDGAVYLERLIQDERNAKP